MEVHGKLVDIHNEVIFPATITVEKGIITKIERNSHRGRGFILPGFIDAHIHIESSLLPPSEFARMAVRHGTVATVSDPKLIASILGMSGIEYMLIDGRKAPLKFFFGAPANLNTDEVRELLQRPEIHYLGETRDTAKIQIAKEFKKPIDGNAEGLFGEKLKKYCSEGVSTDYSSTTLSEARERRAAGMKILVQEGSIAKNLTALFPLMQEDPENCMFCTDHLLPDHLMLGHINLLVKRAIQKGLNPFAAIRCGSKVPVEHYGLDVGLLRVGDPADFIIVEDLESFRVLETYIDGECIFLKTPLFPHLEASPLNHSKIKIVKLENFGLKKGAIASSVTCDPNTVVVCGQNEEDIRNAVDAILQKKGGISLSYKGITETLPLPIGGLMSTMEGEAVARRYSDLDQILRSFGTNITLTLLLDKICLNSRNIIESGGSWSQ